MSFQIRANSPHSYSHIKPKGVRGMEAAAAAWVQKPFLPRNVQFLSKCLFCRFNVGIGMKTEITDYLFRYLSTKEALE